MAGSGRSRRLRGGFTFLELLVALAILGSSFVVLLTAHSSALRQEARARRLMIASMLGRELLARTDVEGFPDLGGDSGEFEGYPDFAWERTTETTPFPGVREVRITISWPEAAGTSTTEFLYYAVGGE
ncbi:MAG: type IV pilus modification PilV family protein [Deferrisomatales bacterium]